MTYLLRKSIMQIGYCTSGNRQPSGRISTMHRFGWKWPQSVSRNIRSVVVLRIYIWFLFIPHVNLGYFLFFSMEDCFFFSSRVDKKKKFCSKVPEGGPEKYPLGSDRVNTLDTPTNAPLFDPPARQSRTRSKVAWWCSDPTTEASLRASASAPATWRTAASVSRPTRTDPLYSQTTRRR